jgi:hypothetical protein
MSENVPRLRWDGTWRGAEAAPLEPLVCGQSLNYEFVPGIVAQRSHASANRGWADGRVKSGGRGVIAGMEVAGLNRLRPFHLFPSLSFVPQHQRFRFRALVIRRSWNR